MLSKYCGRLNLCYSNSIIPKAYMSAQSKKDWEAIMLYNKLRKKPVTGDEELHLLERKIAKRFFDQIRAFRERSEQGFKPSKLFMVWRSASLVNRPIWEKEAMIELGLVDHKVKYAIVKNTASNNEFLMTIKHLIRIKPITFPDGFPTEEDLYNTYLKQTGELIVDKRLHVDCEELEKDEELKRRTLDQRTVREDLRLMWHRHYPKMY